MSDSERRTGYGEDVVRALVRGNSIPALRLAALDRARTLFGPHAALEIECVENIYAREDGDFGAFVIVRRTDDGEEWLPPAGDLEVPE